MSILYVNKIILFHLGELHADDANSVGSGILCSARLKWSHFKLENGWGGCVGGGRGQLESKNSYKRVKQYILVRAREFTKMCE
jgi:hypothetical protein